MECKFCNHTFKTNAIIHQHQKSAKYCIKLQKADLIQKNKCSACEKCFITKSRLEAHLDKCQKNKLKTEIDTLKSEIDTLKSELKYIKSKNPILPVTLEGFKSFADQLTLQHIKDGYVGYGRFAAHYPFKGRVICTDKSRKKMKFINYAGNLSSNSAKLMDIFTESIRKQNTVIVTKYIFDMMQRMVLPGEDEKYLTIKIGECGSYLPMDDEFKRHVLKNALMNID